ncbi:MAG: hypothetical protein RR201_02185 [Malacoplasma sp.]
MNQSIKESIKKLYTDGKKIFNEFINDKEDNIFLKLGQKYQSWYTIANITVKELVPTRYDDFIECYKCSKRKEISFSNFTMSDYLVGISISLGDTILFKPKTAGLIRFKMQLDIIKAINENFENTLFNIKNSIEFELLDNELKSTKKLLKNGYLRSAGAVCGVILEKHFASVLENHKLCIKKKEPCISDYNDLFKNENVYDTVKWRLYNT